MKNASKTKKKQWLVWQLIYPGSSFVRTTRQLVCRVEPRKNLPLPLKKVSLFLVHKNIINAIKRNIALEKLIIFWNLKAQKKCSLSHVDFLNLGIYFARKEVTTMLTRSKLIARLSDWMGIKKDVLARYGTALGKNQAINVGGRGLNAPQFTARDTALLLTSYGATSSSREASDKAKRYGWLFPDETQCEYPLLGSGFGRSPNGRTELLVWFEDVLKNPCRAYEVHSFTFCRTWPEATLRFKEGPAVHFSESQHEEVRPLVKEEVTFAGELLVRISKLLVEGTDMDWSRRRKNGGD